ncbi:MAG: serine hydrolase domain-containing protein [Pyrinomonadaceae bacterium]
MRHTFLNKTRWLLMLVAVLGTIGTSYAQTSAQTTGPAKISLAFEKELPGWLKEANVPAAGVAIIEGGKLRYAKIFGELKRGTPSPQAQPANAIFQVASLTKPVVEVLTLRLVSAHQWNLDEPLARYWVDPDVQNDPRHKKLTTRHVLTHQSGFPNWRTMNASKKLEFMADPGTKVNYSGEGLEYLRRALEKKFNQPLEQLAAKWLFQPYGMKRTRFFWDSSIDESLFAVAHNAEGKPYDVHKHTTANAADLLLTTLDDYARFSINVMKGEGLSRAVFDDMVRPQAPYPSGKNIFFGLGWMILPDLSSGEYALVHTGSDPGVNTVVILFPKSQRGLIVFTNGDNGTKIWTRILAESFDVGKEMLGRA